MRLPAAAPLLAAALLLAALTAASPADGGADAKPLLVYVLVGQSNMEGHATLEVLDYLGEDPATAPLLEAMRDKRGKPAEIEDVWISYLTGERGRIDAGNDVIEGPLTLGYGSRGGVGPNEAGRKIGPEMGFGITLHEALDRDILIIKCAWGGQSLHTDFRPPSAGPSPEDPEGAKTGVRYRQMMEHVDAVLADPGRVVKGYSKRRGYELGGVVWFQGWNDLVNRNVYPEVPDDSPTPRFAAYTEVMAHFIRDVRTHLQAPELPFVIGVIGVDGEQPNKHIAALRTSQAAVAALEEFQGNVVAVPTAPYWDAALAALDAKRQQLRQKRYHLDKQHEGHENADGSLSQTDKDRIVRALEAELFSEEDLDLERRAKSNAGYHYLGSAKTYTLIGKAFAAALLGMRVER